MNEIQTEMLDRKSVVSYDYARALVIANDMDCQKAIEYEQGLSALIKEIDATFDPHIKKAFETHRGLVAEKKRHVEPVEEAKRIIKGKRIVYADAQEAIRRAEVARLQAEVRRAEEERLLREAEALEAEGLTHEAEAVIAEPVVVPVVTVPRTTPSAGISGAIKNIWSAEVYNLKELVMAIAKDRASIGLIEPNMVALNGLARSLKENMSIPGVRAIKERV